MNTEIRLQELEIEIGLAQLEYKTMMNDDQTSSWDEHCQYMQPVWDKLNKLDREKRMLITPEFEDLPDYGEVMSLKDFIGCVKGGGFIDYDGFGNYVKDGKMSNITIYPSDIEHKVIRPEFDKIIWFNR